MPPKIPSTKFLCGLAVLLLTSACLFGRTLAQSRCDTVTTGSYCGSCPSGWNTDATGACCTGIIVLCSAYTKTCSLTTPKCCSGYATSSCSPCPGGAQTPCNNHGTCFDTMNGNGTCACSPGYFGPACEYAVSTTASVTSSSSPTPSASPLSSSRSLLSSSAAALSTTPATTTSLPSPSLAFSSAPIQPTSSTPDATAADSSASLITTAPASSPQSTATDAAFANPSTTTPPVDSTPQSAGTATSAPLTSPSHSPSHSPSASTTSSSSPLSNPSPDSSSSSLLAIGVGVPVAVVLILVVGVLVRKRAAKKKLSTSSTLALAVPPRASAQMQLRGSQNGSAPGAYSDPDDVVPAPTVITHSAGPINSDLYARPNKNRANGTRGNESNSIYEPVASSPSSSSPLSVATTTSHYEQAQDHISRSSVASARALRTHSSSNPPTEALYSTTQDTMQDVGGPSSTASAATATYASPQAPCSARPSFTSASPALGSRVLTTPLIRRDTIVLLDHLGEGESGRVMTAKYYSSPTAAPAIVAVKILKETASEKMRRDFLEEAELLKKFQNFAIVGIIGLCIDQAQPATDSYTSAATTTPSLLYPYMIVLEHLPFGALDALLRKCKTLKIDLSVHERLFMCHQISSALEYFASINFVHRDLASRNCLVGSDCVVKISDFGLSKVLSEETDYYKVQSKGRLPVRTMAPESLSYRKFTLASDIFSMATLFWEIFTNGEVPWESTEVTKLLDNYASNVRLPRPMACPPEMYAIMLDCWALDPSQRPSAKQVSARILSLSEYNKAAVRDIGAKLFNKQEALSDAPPPYNPDL